MTLFPQSIEKYVPQDSPVRAYDAVVEALDFIELGTDIDPYKVGNSEYDPKAMLKLLVYGYSYGVKSSRKLDLIAGNVLFVDGTKIRANAARAKTREKAWYEKYLQDVDLRIEQLLNESEAIDQQEQHLGSFVSMDKELTQAENLKSKIHHALEEFKKTEREKIHQTDPDCALMRSVQGRRG